MPPPKDRLPLSFRQLCVIARTELEQEPGIDDFEWRERIKSQLVASGFQYPRPPHLLTAAMEAVQTAMEKRWGPRPVPTPEPLPPRPPSPRPLTRPEATAIRRQLEEQLRPARSSIAPTPGWTSLGEIASPSSTPTTPPRPTPPQQIDEFWTSTSPHRQLQAPRSPSSSNTPERT